MCPMQKKLKLFSGGDWKHRGGRLIIVATSVADAARLLELARRANRGATADEIAEPVDKFDIGRNSRWIKQSYGVDEDFRSLYGKKIPAERGVWHAKEDGNGMSVDELNRLV